MKEQFYVTPEGILTGTMSDNKQITAISAFGDSPDVDNDIYLVTDWYDGDEHLPNFRL